MIIDTEIGLFRCKKCGRVFWANEMSSRLVYCKLCQVNYAREWRERNKERYRNYKRHYAKKPEQHEYSAERRLLDRTLFPEKVAAINKLNNAMRYHKIEKQPCEVCGDPNTHAHHNDYSKPLEVRWLCPRHHAQVHKRLKEEQQ